jgi:hypothetical protein
MDHSHAAEARLRHALRAGLMGSAQSLRIQRSAHAAYQTRQFQNNCAIRDASYPVAPHIFYPLELKSVANLNPTSFIERSGAPLYWQLVKV